MNQVQPWQIVIPHHEMGLMKDGEGNVALMIRSPAPNITIIVPMDEEEAQEVGRKMAAAHIIIAGAGDIPAAPQPTD